MTEAKTMKEKQNLVKAKIISKVYFNVEFENMEMGKAQSAVAKEMHESMNIELEECKQTVRLVIAELIQKNVA